jgi:hypothetical protein
MSRRRYRNRSWQTSAWEHIQKSATTFDPKPVQPKPRPDTRRLDPVTRAFRLLFWRAEHTAATLAPDGTIHAIWRWCLRVGWMIALPLGLVWVALTLIQGVLTGLGGVFGSLIGIGCIILAIAIIALRLSR